MSVFAWAKVSAPYMLQSALVDPLPGRPPDQLVCTLTSRFCAAAQAVQGGSTQDTF